MSPLRFPLALLLALAACSSSPPPAPPEVPGVGAAPTAADDAELRKWSMEAVPRDYPLYPGDEIEVKVQGHPELTILRKIPSDGKVPVYLQGAGEGGKETMVTAAGKRPPELEREFRSHYEKLVTSPYVTVRATSFAPKSIYIAGAVGNPGDFRLPDDQRISLVQALTMAGWFAENAADDRVRLMRLDPATGKRFFLPAIDVRRIVADADVSLDVALEPGDTITVDSRESRPVFIFGYVEKPGEYPWETGLTLSRLIVLSGGLKDFAKTTKIKVLRPGKGPEPQVFSVDLEAIFDQEANDFPLVPGDVIRVDERFI